jgi:hypothetical protein
MPVTRKDIAVPSEYEQSAREEPLVDFGFSIEGHGPSKPVPQMPQLAVLGDVSKYKMVLDFVVKRFFSLLDNLAVNPETETIKWPNRLQRIVALKNEIQKKLDELKK